MDSVLIPKDKFGNPIYPSTFAKMKQNEKVLLALGYTENGKNPNLFFKRIPQGWFDADMRGTPDVLIWQDARPLFYWFLDKETPRWLRRRLVKQEMVPLFNSGCPTRLTYAFGCDDQPDEFEEVSLEIDDEEGVYIWDDGYCRLCGKDFQDEGSFCSKVCEMKYMDSIREVCQACKGRIELFKEVRHHTSYFPEKIVLVHPSCHNKIHKTNLFPHLKPSKEEVDMFYKNSKTITPLRYDAKYVASNEKGVGMD